MSATSQHSVSPDEAVPSPVSSISSPHRGAGHEGDVALASPPSSPYVGGPGSPIASIAKRAPKAPSTSQYHTQQPYDQYAPPPISNTHQQPLQQPHGTPSTVKPADNFSPHDGRAPFMSDAPFLLKLEHFPRRGGTVVIQQNVPVHIYMPPILHSILWVLNHKVDGKINLNRLRELCTNQQDILEEEDFEPFIFIKNLPVLSTVLTFPRKSPIPMKSMYSPALTLALDLDETLVHCSIQPIDSPDLTFRVNFNGMDYEVFVRIRPHLEYFLKQVSQWFEVIVFTASQKVYADSLLNIIDPRNEYITHRVFRDSCVCIEGNYLKDLHVLGRPLDKVVIVDNSFQAFGFQLDNGIPIESWFDDDHDSELLHLVPFLRHLKDVKDVRPYIRQAFKLSDLVQSIVPSPLDEY